MKVAKVANALILAEGYANRRLPRDDEGLLAWRKHNVSSHVHGAQRWDLSPSRDGRSPTRRLTYKFPPSDIDRRASILSHGYLDIFATRV